MMAGKVPIKRDPSRRAWTYGFRLRATTLGGVVLDLSGSYDGIGSTGYDAIIAKVLVRLLMN